VGVDDNRLLVIPAADATISEGHVRMLRDVDQRRLPAAET
jgi:hypothetical protein